MGANLKVICPVEGCDYTERFRPDTGAEDTPEDHSTRYEFLRGEHPHHPAPGERGRKPKDVGAWIIMPGRDCDLSSPTIGS